MEYIYFTSHDRALDLDCLERMALVMGALMVVIIFEYLLSTTPTLLISAFASLGAMVYCFTRWIKMCTDRNPFKNCWAYNRKDK